MANGNREGGKSRELRAFQSHLEAASRVSSESAGDIRLAWAAGFFDGEGSTGLLDRTGFGMAMTVAQTDMRPLQRLVEALGGRGKIYGPLNRPNPAWKPMWTWRCSKRDDVIVCLLLLWPYLSEPKREQAQRVLASVVDRITAAEQRHFEGPCRRGHSFEFTKYDARGFRFCTVCVAQTRPKYVPVAVNKSKGPQPHRWHAQCKYGHSEWGFTTKGKRYCLACNRINVKKYTDALKTISSEE